MTDTMERFWQKVDGSSEDGCWTWLAGLNFGYGRFWIDGRHVGAHRFAYESLVGEVPAGLQLDHLCRNRACVRPDHLEPVTQGENNRRAARDSYRWARRGLPACRRGHEYTPENTYVTPDGYRHCRICQRASWRRTWRAWRGDL